MKTIQIAHFLNGKPYEDDFTEAINEYNSINAASYVLTIDKDCAEEAMMDGNQWIDSLTVSEIISYVPEHELLLRLSDGSIYKEIINH